MSIFLVSMIALAQADENKAFSMTSHGDLRLNMTSRPGFVVDFEGRELNSGITFDSRLRTGINVKLQNWSLDVGGDLFHGNFAGTPWNLEGGNHRYHPEQIGVLDADDFLLRSLQIRGGTKKIHIQSGVTTSHWGLGLVANDGAHEQLFGRQDYGDRVFRTSLVLRPKENIVLMTGGDWVLEDDIGGWKDGYESYQGLASAQFFFSKENKIGILGVYRHQTEIETQKTLEGFFADIYATGQKNIGDGILKMSMEGAYLHGDTDRISNRNNPNGLLVRSFGGIGELEYHVQDAGVVGLRGGFASGDADPSDERYTTFTFDRDSNAGNLLFDVHQAAREIAEYNLLTDPEHAGKPPDGVDSLITEGAIRQTTFLQPTLQYHITDWLDVAVGNVFAWSTTPIKSSFISYRNGGAALNHLGEPTDGYFLGTEYNWLIGLHNEELGAVKGTGHFEIQGSHITKSENLGIDKGLYLIRCQTRFLW